MEIDGLKTSVDAAVVAVYPIPSYYAYIQNSTSPILPSNSCLSVLCVWTRNSYLLLPPASPAQLSSTLKPKDLDDYLVHSIKFNFLNKKFD